MASLLSVLLVSSSSSGPRLLFAYPPNAVATPRVQRPLYGKSPAVRDAQARSPTHEQRDGHRVRGTGEEGSSSSSSDEEDGLDMFGSRFIRGESSSSSSSAYSGSSSSEDEGAEGEEYTYTHDEYLTREQRQKESYKVHLGIDTSVLGTLLCPSKELCNKRFEMVVNHLAFIAHPVGKRPKQPPRPPRSARPAEDRTLTRTNTFETTFASDDEAEGEDASSGTAEGAQTLLERRRGRRPRDLRTSVGEESVQARLAYRSNPGSGASSRRTSQSMPGPRPTYPWEARPGTVSRRGSSSAAPATRELPLTRDTASEQAAETPHLEAKTERISSSTSAPPFKSRHLQSSQLQMSSSVAGNASHDVSSGYAGLATSGSSMPLQGPSSATGEDETRPESDLSVFSVVLVIDSPPDQQLTYHLGVYYRDVIAPLMSALKSIERSAGYISREAELIASLRERAQDIGTPLTPHIEDLRHKSDLCAQLAALYHGIKERGMAELVLNDDIEMTVILHQELFSTPSSASHTTALPALSSTSRPFSGRVGAASGLRRQHNAYDQYNLGASMGGLRKLSNRTTDGGLEGPILHTDILPWQTLLPLIEPEEMLQSLNDLDGEDELIRFLEIMNPTLTFSEYETLLDTDSDSIIAIVEHLTYFRRAKLIDAISMKCIYVPVRPTEPGYTKLLAIWTQEFAWQFPDLPSLPALLASLSPPIPFDTLIPSGPGASHLRGIYLDALIWLLRHDLVYQMRLFATLIANPEIKRAAYEREEARQKREKGKGSNFSEKSISSERDKRKIQRQDSRVDPDEGDGEEGGSSGFSARTTSSNATIAGSMPHTAPSGAKLSSTPASITSTSHEGKAASLTTSDTSGGSSGLHGLADNRSPLPSSYPSSYPYMSAVSAMAAARPSASGLHRHQPSSSVNQADSASTGSSMRSGPSKSRKVFLSALNAPSIISNPGEPTAEEELWIQEIQRTVTERERERSEPLESASGGARRKMNNSSAVFARVLPYLDGSHSLEEILYRAGVTRKALRATMADFSESIVTFLA